jgi:hypothetical protein
MVSTNRSTVRVGWIAFIGVGIVNESYFYDYMIVRPIMADFFSPPERLWNLIWARLHEKWGVKSVLFANNPTVI